MKALRLFAAPLIAVVLSACQNVPLGSGGGDQWGARPGPQGFTTVVIDAGHGGKDSGARSRSTGQMEKTAALDIAQRLGQQLRGSFRVVMMRNNDTFVPLDERVRTANRYGNGILVSIHLNSGPKRLNGPETFYWRSDSYSLAKRIQSSLSSTMRSSSNSRGLTRRRLRLTRNPTIPCVLVECGYLSNSREASCLAQSSYREALARAIAAAIRNQAACGDAGMGALPKPIYAPPSKGTDHRE
jgi:N-acetylmuramoyl-L-alanine amidase